jgi:hypothetical protein
MGARKRQTVRKAPRSRRAVLQGVRVWIDQLTDHLARAPIFHVDADDLAALPRGERIVVERARHAAVYIRDLVREVLLVFERSAATLGRRRRRTPRRRNPDGPTR